MASGIAVDRGEGGEQWRTIKKSTAPYKVHIHLRYIKICLSQGSLNGVSGHAASGGPAPPSVPVSGPPSSQASSQLSAGI
jgi:hypothetical protein